MKRLWKRLDYFEGQFWISNKGEVYNQFTERYIVGDINSSGYYRVGMWYNKQLIRKFRHRLVAKYFIPNEENKRFVNHIDGVKSNNWSNNLEWVTQSENEVHAFKNKLKPSPNSKPYNVVFLNGYVRTYDIYSELANELNVSPTLIGQWIRLESFTYKKYNIKEIYLL